MQRYDLSPVFGGAAGVFISLSAWCTVYLIVGAYSHTRRAEWHCRMTTVVHAALICLLSSYAAAVQGPWPFTDPGGANTPLQRFTVIVCLGYFLFDFAWCLTFKTEGAAMMVHHALSILGLTVTLFRGKYGTEMMAAIFGTECTNPLLQLRWFLRETGRQKTKTSFVNDLVFVFCFGFFRIGVGSYLLYVYFQHPAPDWLGRVGGCVLYLIGWMFWIQICVYVYRKFICPRGCEQTREQNSNGISHDQAIRNGAFVQNGGEKRSNTPDSHVNNLVNGLRDIKQE